MKRTTWVLVLSLQCLLGWSQAFTEDDWAKGFAHRQDSTYFLFNPLRYGEESLEKVSVTGSFRGWSQDLDDPAWQLRLAEDSNWTLGVYNPKFTVIPPRAEFKFRINSGTWLSPPVGTPNEKGGNLVFLQDMTPPTLKAELRSSGNIWMFTDGFERSSHVEDYRLTDAKGHEIPIAEILPNTYTEALVIPAEELDINRVYYLEFPQKYLKTLCSYDGWFRTIYSSKELGANISEDGSETVFRVFAPRAQQIKLYLYKAESGDQPYEEVDMNLDRDGVWEAFVKGNLKGVYYDFTVHGADDPGNHFYGSKPVHISDPYARVNVESWGRSRVWPKTTPATALTDGIPKHEDLIAYEVHVQDFTDLLPVDEDLKGTLPAFHQSGLKNSKGEPVGFDYLVNLGINVVHLMPVQEFLHYDDEDWKAAFKDDPFMIEQGISEENYQWGYRTSHAFAVEGRFRKKGTERGSEREQFRDLVQAFHDKDIAVIIDIVPNHTAENMDRDPYFMHWNVLDKQYYYRTRDLEHIGEYGNEVKTENRPMVQRWLIDQCRHFIEEFGIDGFRIDLAGQIDKQTLIKLRQALGPDIIIYGEPWIASNDPDYENNPSWDWYKHDSPIMFFQDDARNAIKGPVSNPHSKGEDRGYAGGNFREKEKVKRALTSHFPDDRTPLSGISYLDIHDNWALADQFAKSDWDGRFGVDEERYKIAALLLYTSLGPIVTHGGSEMMRSKGAAALKETIKETQSGIKVYLHGKRDTYNMRKANQFIWEQAGRTTDEQDIHCDYAGMYAFWQGLNKFRLSEVGQIFRRSEPVDTSYYRWIDTVNPYQLGYLVDGQVLVLINTGGEDHDWDDVYLPEGTWKLVGDLSGFDHEAGVSPKDPDAKMQGGQMRDFRLAGPSFKVWIKE
ncbi:alpha-amylase family glycosyl hydrolase [Pontibacter sp. G13]|uniref:alpha-amylase family glycosyl hydrolase n=1 Tax=Pontibacter sp. G13 TaxID=3074898 RepID=UPI0028893950|nr:alpha-amylase family glycosyl hydrolase [Pontibacter sp. G13]WNJ21228.1 alpha-amylase family glycosyl hydrolase [Pontibacter sp. G13]